jgi:hypothetical protein
MENGFIFIYNEFSESLQRLTLEGISKDILKGKEFLIVLHFLIL